MFVFLDVVLVGCSSILVYITTHSFSWTILDIYSYYLKFCIRFRTFIFRKKVEVLWEFFLPAAFGVPALDHSLRCYMGSGKLEKGAGLSLALALVWQDGRFKS